MICTGRLPGLLFTQLPRKMRSLFLKSTVITCLMSLIPPQDRLLPSEKSFRVKLSRYYHFFSRSSNFTPEMSQGSNGLPSRDHVKLTIVIILTVQKRLQLYKFVQPFKQYPQVLTTDDKIIDSNYSNKMIHNCCPKSLRTSSQNSSA